MGLWGAVLCGCLEAPPGAGVPDAPPDAAPVACARSFELDDQFSAPVDGLWMEFHSHDPHDCTAVVDDASGRLELRNVDPDESCGLRSLGCYDMPEGGAFWVSALQPRSGVPHLRFSLLMGGGLRVARISSVSEAEEHRFRVDWPGPPVTSALVNELYVENDHRFWRIARQSNYLVFARAADGAPDQWVDLASTPEPLEEALFDGIRVELSTDSGAATATGDVAFDWIVGE